MMKKIVYSALTVLALLLIWTGVSFYPDWLWFGSLNFASVFWTMFLSKLWFGAVIWLVFVGVIFPNLYIAHRVSREKRAGGTEKAEEAPFAQRPLSGKTLSALFIILVLIASFIIASKGSLQWDIVLSYIYQQPFDGSDPVFQRDIGFYVFSLPFYRLVQNGLQIIFLFAGLLAAMWYLKDGVLQVIDEPLQDQGRPIALPKVAIWPKAKKHLVILGGLIILFLAWGYYLKAYEVLYSTQGPAFGASYTDVHVRIFGYRLLAVASLVLAVILFLNASRPGAKLVWVSGGIWLGGILLFSTLLPMAVQKFLVKPNELAKESPYIAYNIDYTRKAYNLDKIKEIDFQVTDKLLAEDIENHQGTIQNIRIWDERPLLQTYRQIQAIRLYYDFNNVDVDRYLVNGQFRQVMLAARELVAKQLPPQAYTWVNRHLTYTHGYGLASSPVNEVTREGLPRLFIKDLPPVFESDMRVDRPEIYYGEKTEEYVLIKTKTQEFDYPKGDKNVYTNYQGKGGVPVNSFARRLLYALEFLDPQILFTNYLTPESRIMYNRRLDRRVRSLAPFLDYDRDPYLVVSKGRLFWIQDAYTTSNMYPYSRRSYGYFNNKALNYIRNSVKVTIDAYNGDVSFYVMDEKDPIIKTFSRIFPDLFRPFKEMPAELKSHVRYPRDLFDIQVGTYGTYHMEDVQVFYNQEDLWQIPDEIYGDSRQGMKPYYIIIKLPGEDREEFLLMIPFTPSKKDNMIGWLAARCDPSVYGNLMVFKLPKEKLVFGPMQIEARVDQQTEISRELSLWSQHGSRVIRGNLLAIPIGDAFLYVEPVYLEAKQEASASSPQRVQGERRGLMKRQNGQGASSPGADKSKAASLPELKRVIAVLGNHVVMGEDLDKALRAILEEDRSPEEKGSPVDPVKQDIYRLSRSALEHYNRAKDFLRQGMWGEYGKEIENLEKILEEMSFLKGEKK
jgi:uncharacterized membrane protein (UPF0182 family)